jgi:galactitol-specific phosphotransferase system IIC component
MMELLGELCHVESRFGPFGDSVSVGARYWYGLRQTCQLNLLGDVDHVESRFGLFGDSISVGARLVYGLH